MRRRFSRLLCSLLAFATSVLVILPVSMAVTPNISPLKAVELVPSVLLPYGATQKGFVELYQWIGLTNGLNDASYLSVATSDKGRNGIELGVQSTDGGDRLSIGKTVRFNDAQAKLSYHVDAPEVFHKTLPNMTLEVAKEVTHTDKIRLAYRGLMFSSVILTQGNKVWYQAFPNSQWEEVKLFGKVITDIAPGAGSAGAIIDGKAYIWGKGSPITSTSACSGLCLKQRDLLPPDATGLKRDDPAFSTLPHQVQGIEKPLVSITMGYRMAAALDIYGNVWAWTHDDKPRIVSKTGDYATCVAEHVTWRIPPKSHGTPTLAEKVNGIKLLFDAMDKANPVIGDLQERADVLATADIETYGLHDMVEPIQPVDAEKQYGSTAGNSPAADPNHPELGDGFRYRGHGFNHLTGKGNYAAAGVRMGLGDALVQNPDMVSSDLALSARITVEGMRDGNFRGHHKLADYHNEDGTYDYFNSREIINGDKATHTGHPPNPDPVSIGEHFAATGKQIEQVMRDCLSNR